MILIHDVPVIRNKLPLVLLNEFNVYRPSGRRLSMKLVLTFAAGGVSHGQLSVSSRPIFSDF
jgi:hypothetical protein